MSTNPPDPREPVSRGAETERAAAADRAAYNDPNGRGDYADSDRTVAMDTNGDGYADTRRVDTDGYADTHRTDTRADTNGDGYADTRRTDTRRVDTDGDGYPDRTVAAAPVATDRRVSDERRPVGAGGAGAVVARDDVVARERERFGGMKFGSAFFGWLTAMGLVVLLTAIVAAIGGAIGMSSPQTAQDAADAAQQNLGTTTIIGAIVIGIVLFVGYFAGGYVAGRMARFSGLMQGLGVWLWAIIIAIVVAIITAIAGAQWDIFGNLNSFPRIPVTSDQLTLTGILTAVGAAVVTLVGALLGGVTGMRYHRRVDRVGLGLEE